MMSKLDTTQRQLGWISMGPISEWDVSFKSYILWPGTVAHTCIPSTLREAKVGGSQVRRSRPSWPTRWNPISSKIQKIRQTWWHALVVPATQEAEAGESLKPGRWRLQWAKITPLHTSLATEQDSVSTTTKVTYCIISPIWYSQGNKTLYNEE